MLPPTAASGQVRGAAVIRSKREHVAFPVVGIGASAGGLEAYTELLKALPLDTGMAFVLVQHLDPQHESALARLLAKATRMPVLEASHQLEVRPNHVYVIAPNTTLCIKRGILRLEPRSKARAPHRSVDFFLQSLSEDQGERAIGVVLSGSATDGTLGLEAIKAEGGITFAQDASARYDSMPRNAIAAGCVDFVLSPKGIAEELARIAAHPLLAGVPPGERSHVAANEARDEESPLPSGGSGTPATGARRARAESRGNAAGADRGYDKIMLLLRNHSGVDFSLYKSNTIQRRITRRMVLSRCQTLADYADFLRGEAKELDALFTDVLISVTSFFRNPEAFEVLQRKVFPKLLAQRDDTPLRAWVLGCSTGQEAYSIAMSFSEAAASAPRARKLQIFATDLNEALLEKARHGLYARSLADDISPERLRRFFVEEEGGYRVVKPLREMVVFARQNLIGDPPFSRMDLVSCRNLLIYLEPDLQRKALPTFHYALRPGGFLFLGASESISGFTELFEPLDKKHKIFARKAAPAALAQLPPRGAAAVGVHKASPPRRVLPAQSPTAPDGFRTELSAQREADRVSVNQFAPPSVLINSELQVLQFRGPTGPWLQPPAGKASFDLLKMAREGLMLPLRGAINEARKENKAVRRENLRVGDNGCARRANVEVIPLKNLRERCFLVVFEHAGEASAGSTLPGTKRGDSRLRGDDETGGAPRQVEELEAELAETRDFLQAMQEQHEAADEELQASNEEVQSANEELQSVNEELETSKEELESANEELTTLNDELSHRNAELNRLNGDLLNLQTSTRLAIVLLARDLTIRRFSAQAEKQFSLAAADLGRPFGHVRHRLLLPDLENLIGEVISSVREIEREVKDVAGRWFSLRVRPYFTLDNKVDGAVLVLVDIAEQKRGQQAIAAARDYAQAVIYATRDPLLILNGDLRVHGANEAFYRTFEVTPEESAGRLVYDLGNRQWNIPKLRELLEDILPRKAAFDDFEVSHEFQSIGPRIMLLNARRLDEGQGQPARILLGIQDVSRRRQAEEEFRRDHAVLERQAEELTRFNRLAVGRELRMVELKHEINELRRRLGEPPRYAPEAERPESRRNPTGEPLSDKDGEGESQS